LSFFNVFNIFSLGRVQPREDQGKVTGATRATRSLGAQHDVLSEELPTGACGGGGSRKRVDWIDASYSQSERATTATTTKGTQRLRGERRREARNRNREVFFRSYVWRNKQTKCFMVGLLRLLMAGTAN
jgi:hypothetical protein